MINRMSNRELMSKFIEFVTNYLEIKTPLKIKLTKERGDIVTTAYYDIVNKVTLIYIKDRAIMDIMRSLAHEMVHHQQNERGLLTGDTSEGDDGSEIENEANAVAGVIMRLFGKQNPEIYTNND